MLMTPEDRRALINKPFPRVRILTRSYTWAGVLINRDIEGVFPNHGKRLIDDESETDYSAFEGN